jgi:4-hydroxy-tetrahydrodipicolinate reductase
MEAQATPIAIHGAAGRMGQRLVALGAASKQIAIVAALETAGHPRLGEDAGTVAGLPAIGVPLTTELPADSTLQALIDFSSPTGAAAAVQLAAARNIPLVMATTGLEPSVQASLKQLAETVPVVWAPSMSLAVNLTMKLAELAGSTLVRSGTSTDVEIMERHHRFKEDAPSGTALKFGQRLAQAMGLSQHVHGRHGQLGPRPRDEIAYHALRVGDNPGEHTIVFGMLGETIELTVRASNRDCYASGALQAARFVAQQPPGLYSMDDVLGL